MFIYLLLIFLILLVYQSLFRYTTRTGRLIDKIPGPKTFPLLTNLLDLYRLSVQGWDYIYSLQKKYYPIAKIWAFTDYIVFMFHPDDLKVLLSHKKNINKSSIFYDQFRMDGWDGLALNNGDKWRSRRKMINPSFRSNILRDYARKTDSHIDRFIDNLCSRGNQFVVDLSEEYKKLGFEIISDAVMGVNVGKYMPGMSKMYIESFELHIQASFYFAFRPYIPSWIAKYMHMGRVRDERIEILNATVKEIIADRRKHNERDGFKNLMDRVENDIDVNHEGAHRDVGFLDQLLAAEMKGLIDEHGLIEEINVMFNAGYETTSVAMELTLALLAENKEAQDLARNEVIKVMKESGSTIKMEEASRLTYLSYCIKETLRLFPSAPLVGREIVEELQLKNCTLPVKTQVIIPILAIHRDPNFWPNPSEFDPNRFLPENVADRHPYSYIPFGSGLRNCIGQQFGMMELITVVAHVLYNFRLEAIVSTKDLIFPMNHVVLKAEKPVLVKFIKINHN